MKEIILIIILLLFAGCASQEQGTTTTTTKADTSTTQTSFVTTTYSTTNPVPSTLPDCDLLWWFDNETNDKCRQDLFCGAYMYESLRTFQTSAECNASLPVRPSTTTLVQLGLGATCAESRECESRCCVYLNGKKTCMDKEECRRNLSESECLERNMHWCATKCQLNPCGNCGDIMRCIGSSADAKIEYASDYPGKTGSCRFNQRLEAAGGVDGYCDRMEGSMIYAVCGRQATFQDCMEAYNQSAGTYAINQRRSFHSETGEEYDLICFRCDKLS